MRYGLALPNGGGDPQTMAEFAALARRRPWKVAREAVTLDHLSNGRVILGVGLGDNTVEDRIHPAR